MMKKLIVLITAAVLTVGTATMVYAKGKDDRTVNSFTKTSAYELKNVNTNNVQEIIIQVMEQSGHKDLADEARKGNYASIDEFVKNMTDADFQTMIQIMKDNGYSTMASMMESLGRDGMIRMHNTMGGAAGCFAANGKANGSNVSTNSNFRGMMRNGGMMGNLRFE